MSDLHVAHPQNRLVVDRLRPTSDRDWLVVAGDVAELVTDVAWTLASLRRRFARVIWTPGNHELWTARTDPVQLRGQARYEHLVEVCRALDVDTPEDPFPVWDGAGGPVTVAPLFVGYDYSFLPAGASSKAQALRLAHDRGVVCTDEFLLHHEPYPSREAWCADRVATTESRLAELDADVPAVLVNHYPLVREPTRPLRYPEFAVWCGTERTADWHRRFNVARVVYGHLHIPRAHHIDGVPFDEVSLGYPRERQRRGVPETLPRPVLPAPPGPGA